jgi:hypothetical protein
MPQKPPQIPRYQLTEKEKVAVRSAKFFGRGGWSDLQGNL